jgi:threonine aldolase
VTAAQHTEPEPQPQPEPPALMERFRRASLRADRRLSGSARPAPAEEMRRVADAVDTLDDPLAWDRYGEFGPVEVLEQQVRELLGKPAAAMFPSGIMAQQSVLRVWCDERGSRRVALPGLSHLLRHELDGPQLLHGFCYERLTDGATVPTVSSLEAIPGSLGAAVLELPLRDGGYLLPSWQELDDFARACSDRGVPLHLDGARIWESQPHLDHGLAEICGLADTVYVSFYKGLAGMAGAAVAGPVDVIAGARRWRSRLGGTLATLMPYAVSALRGLREELPRLPEYHALALALAAELPRRGIRVFPEPPHTNAFRLFAPFPQLEINERIVSFMEREGTTLTPPWEAADVPGWSWTEFTVGRSALEWPVVEAAELLSRVVCGVRTGAHSD